jgi:glycosyltransferase involved in cell wall biosynthesis
VTARQPIRVARVIGRLNIGGPAVQALHVTKLLPAAGLDTRLFRGTESPDEGSMDYLAEELGVRPVRIAAMRRDVGPRDLPALLALCRELRRYRPDIVHTEAAKAGTLGRLAGLLALRRPRPVLVHTFHGHSLEGYFSPRRAAFFLAVERFLARRTTAVVAVADEVKQDLVRLGVTSPDRIRVIRLGLDLEPFQLGEEERAARRAAKREQWDIDLAAPVVTLVARLVPIKRVDRFLRIAGRLAQLDASIRFVIVGDGELRESLRASREAVALGERLHWAGFEHDMPSVYAASDCVVLTSDNEGLGGSLVEAHAAALPAVSTRVGGPGSVIREGESGRLIPPDDERGFADAVLEALANRDGWGRAGRAHVSANFALDRVVEELSELYRSLAGEPREPVSAKG